MGADGSHHRFLVKGPDARGWPDGTRILYFADGEPKGTQIFVRWMDAQGASSQVTRLTETPTDAKWAPDGTAIAFVMLAPDSTPWSISLPKPPEGAKWTPAPRVVDDLHYRQDKVGFMPQGFTHLFLVPADGGTARALTSGRWNVGARFDGLAFGTGYDWTPDGRTIVFDGLRDSTWDRQYQVSRLYVLDVASGAIRPLVSRPGFWASPAVSPDGRTVALTGSDSSDHTHRTADLWTAGLDGSGLRDLSRTLDRDPDNLRWAPDGKGIYFTAPDRGSINVRYVDLAGGLRDVTQGAQVVSLTSLARTLVGVGVRSDPEHGPDVVRMDLRGGEAATRGHAVVGRGYVDTTRLYVSGCSGGGVLSSWVIGHTNRFAAAAVRCPVIDWISMAGQTDIPLFTFSFFRQAFWDKPDEWLAHSSLMHVGRVTTPTLLMTGELDRRTPIPQTEEYYAALKIRNVPTVMLRFNGEYHGTGSKPSNFMRTQLYMMSWFEKHRRSATEPATGAGNR